MQKIIEVIITINDQVATHLAASSFFPSHNLILRKLAAQSQNSNANQRQSIVNGKIILVAQFARYPIPLQINIWSTILYKAFTINDITQGIENFKSNLETFSFHRNASPSFIMQYLILKHKL